MVSSKDTPKLKRSKSSKVTVWVWYTNGKQGAVSFLASEKKPNLVAADNAVSYKMTQEDLDTWLDVQAEYAILQENLHCILGKMFKPA